MTFIIAGCTPYEQSTFVESFHSVHETIELAKACEFPSAPDYDIYFIYKFDGNAKPIYVSAIMASEFGVGYYDCTTEWVDYGTKEWDAMFEAVGSFDDIEDTYIEQSQ